MLLVFFVLPGFLFFPRVGFVQGILNPGTAIHRFDEWSGHCYKPVFS
jgi:hypothetical protein